ncbi:MAG: anti-sigma factor [Acidocella sp.]|nr:anti-sigma factor [Acidocella sp.]
MTPEPQDILASEYVLGLLEGEALREAEALLHANAGFAALVQSWERRLMPLAETTPELPPPPQVWRRIAAATRANSTDATQPAGLRARGGMPTGFIRTRRGMFLAVCGSAVAALVVVVTMSISPQPARQIAMLKNRDGGGFIVAQTKTDMIITPSHITLPSGHVAELWLLAPNHAPQAIGVFQPGHSLDIKLPTTPSPGLSLAVSLEPPGGAPGPTPTGPIIAEGVITIL